MLLFYIFWNSSKSNLDEDILLEYKSRNVHEMRGTNIPDEKWGPEGPGKLENVFIILTL